MITYLELLELIKEGKQPCKIKVTISRFWKAIFVWDNRYGYVEEASFLALPACLANTHSDIALAARRSIEVLEK